MGSETLSSFCVLYNNNKAADTRLWTHTRIQKENRKTQLKPNSSQTYFTAYPRRTFAYSWRKPLGTVSSMTVGYEGFREALGCGSEPVWRGAEPMKSPQQIRHPQLHVALMRRVRDFLTTLFPKRLGFSHAPFSLSFLSPWSNLFYVNGRVMLTPAQNIPSIYNAPAFSANVPLQYRSELRRIFPFQGFQGKFQHDWIAGVLLKRPFVNLLSKSIPHQGANTIMKCK